MEDLISVIIPVHNVQKYLKKCLDSVIKQTYSNLEIILINDSSTDNSEEVCKEYCLKDNRIKLLNNDSKSAGLSRNYGLEKAKGKYVIFVDSDDYIELNMCETLYNQIIKNKSDACFCGYNLVTQIDTERIFLNNEKSIYNYDKKEIKEKIIYNSIYVYDDKKQLPLYAVWNGLYNLEIIKKNEIYFFDENIYFSEDSIFNYEYLSKCQNITIINDNLYNHTLYNNNSICNKYNQRYNYIDDWYNYFIKISNNEKKLINVLQERYLTISFTRIKQEVLLSNKCVFNKIKKIKIIMNNKILQESIKNVDLHYRNKKQKMFIILTKYKLSVLLYVLIRIRKK